MAIAREAGPKPTQRRSRTSSEEAGDMEAVWPFVWLLRWIPFGRPFRDEVPLVCEFSAPSRGEVIADGVILRS